VGPRRLLAGLSVLAAGAVWAEEAASARASLRERMESSRAAQVRAVQRQAGMAQEEAPSWFTVPWPRLEARPPLPSGTDDAKEPEGEGKPADGVMKSMKPKFDCDPYRPAELDPFVQSAASREGLGADLLHAVIRRESGYYPCAVSSKGALGLMQLMPETARSLGVVDPLDPLENLEGGARFLGRLLDRYKGDLGLALGAYNAGPGTVDHYGGVPPYPETQSYINKILLDLGDPVATWSSRADRLLPAPAPR
jgi:hypothetical protein